MQAAKGKDNTTCPNPAIHQAIHLIHLPLTQLLLPDFTSSIGLSLLKANQNDSLHLLYRDNLNSPASPFSLSRTALLVHLCEKRNPILLYSSTCLTGSPELLSVSFRTDGSVARSWCWWWLWESGLRTTRFMTPSMNNLQSERERRIAGEPSHSVVDGRPRAFHSGGHRVP